MNLYKEMFNLDNSEVQSKESITYYFNQRKLYIDAYHPAQTVTKRGTYVNDIINASREWHEKFNNN